MAAKQTHLFKERVSFASGDPVEPGEPQNQKPGVFFRSSHALQVGWSLDEATCTCESPRES